ncbi:MAG: hypothetical protein MZV70_34685 [Desulfobacterales bacterium]|nr:hypothetical protein [Desulfobacterales bacterium]
MRILIEGYEYPPMLMTPHNPHYYRDLMEEAGFEKAKDLYAYLHTVAPELPEKVVRVAASRRKGIRARTIDMKNFGSEMLAFREVYNSSTWQKRLGFPPPRPSMNSGIRRNG